MTPNSLRRRYGPKVTCPCPRQKCAFHYALNADGSRSLFGTCFSAGCPTYSRVRRVMRTEALQHHTVASITRRPKIVGERQHVYRTSNGEPFMRVVVKKYDNGTKGAYCQKFVDGAWHKGQPDAPLILYNLECVIERVALQGPVVIVEGEKDVDTLLQHDVVATTGPFGAKKWKDEYSKPLRDAHVVILPDNDAIGYEHALMVQKSLDAAGAASATIIDLRQLDPSLPEKGDVTDYLQRGGSFSTLLKAIDNAVSAATKS